MIIVNCGISYKFDIIPYGYFFENPAQQQHDGAAIL